MAIKTYATTSIGKHANKLKVHEKTLTTAMKQDLNPYLNPLDYAICGILENKTNFTSKYLFWISEEFILKAFKKFPMHVDTIIEKKKWFPYWVKLLFWA